METISGRYRVSCGRKIHPALLLVKVKVGVLSDERWLASLNGEEGAEQNRGLLDEAPVLVANHLRLAFSAAINSSDTLLRND